MMVLEGKKLGLHFNILDPSHDCPASSIADQHIIGNFYDQEKIQSLAEISDVITYEFEHIDADMLVELEKQGHRIYPSPSTLKIIQNKYEQKNFLQKYGLSVPKFQKVVSIEDIDRATEEYGFPLILKSCKGGYDGKGNYVIKTKGDIKKAYGNLGGSHRDLMIEAYIPFKMEISVLIARGITGEMKIYPLAENIHENNILKTTIAPARVRRETEEKAHKLALKTMEILKGIGIFCIEMFVDQEDNLFINEIAPRTHNSGHYTIEGCSTSQFYQHLRGILGLPLGDTSLVKEAVMINLLGEEGYVGKTKVTGVEKALALSGVYVHIYGKTDTKPNRKMGHATIVDTNVASALKKADYVRDILKIISED